MTHVAETPDTRARSAPTRKGQLTRARILDAARDELAERGYFGSTVAQIATRSGLALGSLYRYFSNKDEIFLELLEELVEDLYTSVAGSWVKGEERQSLRESSLRYLTKYHASRHLIGGLLEMSAAVPECADLWWELRQRTFHRKSVYLHRVLADSSLRPEHAAAALGTMVEQLAYHWYIESEKRGSPAPDLAEAAEIVSFIWYRAIYAS